MGGGALSVICAKVVRGAVAREITVYTFLMNGCREHIPSAQYFDMWHDVTVLPTMSRPLPRMQVCCIPMTYTGRLNVLINCMTSQAFEKQLERCGVCDSDHLILYDKSTAMFSARMYLQCKVGDDVTRQKWPTTLHYSFDFSTWD